jgi:hypothetical protein
MIPQNQGGENLGEGYRALMRPWRLLLQIRDILLNGRLVRARRAFRIGGQGPKVRWKRNEGGLKRTIEEAVAIAKSHGVEIPEDVEFFEAEPGQLKGSLKGYLTRQRFETARGPEMRSGSDGRIHWADHYNREGRIPFLVHPEILTSDEAIVAVFRHEMFELALIREVFTESADGSMNEADYRIQTAVGRPGNFHDLAWDEADKIVRSMRRRSK